MDCLCNVDNVNAVEHLPRLDNSYCSALAKFDQRVSTGPIALALASPLWAAPKTTAPGATAAATSGLSWRARTISSPTDRIIIGASERSASQRYNRRQRSPKPNYPTHLGALLIIALTMLLTVPAAPGQWLAPSWIRRLIQGSAEPGADTADRFFAS